MYLLYALFGIWIFFISNLVWTKQEDIHCCYGETSFLTESPEHSADILSRFRADYCGGTIRENDPTKLHVFLLCPILIFCLSNKVKENFNSFINILSKS